MSVYTNSAEWRIGMAPGTYPETLYELVTKRLKEYDEQRERFAAWLEDDDNLDGCPEPATYCDRDKAINDLRAFVDARRA